MKLIKITFLLLAFATIQIQAQGTWTQKANFGGTERSGAVGFAIENKGYIGTGSSSKNDFWEYDVSTNIWTQKADYLGTTRGSTVGFSIGNKGYIGIGGKKDFWEYDPTTNVWIQKPNFGGAATTSAVAFSIGNKGYIGTGSGNLNDFWEYAPNITGINNLVANGIEVYPNPTNGRFTIKNNVLKIISIEISDINGKAIQNYKFSTQNYQFDLSRFKSGVYFLKITTVEGSYTEKIIKQ